MAGPILTWAEGRPRHQPRDPVRRQLSFPDLHLTFSNIFLTIRSIHCFWNAYAFSNWHLFDLRSKQPGLYQGIHEQRIHRYGYEQWNNPRAPSFISKPGERVYTKALVNTNSRIDWINYIAYSANEHKYMFDRENLSNHLKISGFANIQEREYDPELDKNYGKNASLFFTAT